MLMQVTAAIEKNLVIAGGAKNMSYARLIKSEDNNSLLSILHIGEAAQIAVKIWRRTKIFFKQLRLSRTRPS